jgi:hypothetical protein
VIAAVLRSSPSLREFLAETQRAASHSDTLSWTGVALCVLGFGLAISARWHLGRNWGMPMSRKEQPELVTSGPYAYIRHPIYIGTYSGNARFRDWREHFLDVDAYSRRRVLHIKCATRGIRHVAAIPGAVRGVYGANGDAGAALCAADAEVMLEFGSDNK